MFKYEQWRALKEESHTNIQGDVEIFKHQICSIQTERYFGDIKKFEGKAAEKQDTKRRF